jgi:stage III sporulation protein SpoIIIAA
MGKVFFVELMHPRDVNTAIAAMRGQIVVRGQVAEVDHYVSKKSRGGGAGGAGGASAGAQGSPAKPKPTTRPTAPNAFPAASSGTDSDSVAVQNVVQLLEQNGFESGALLPFDSAYAALSSGDDVDVDRELDTVVRKLFRSPYKRFNTLQLVTAGSEDPDAEDKSRWAFRICRLPDRQLAMAKFVENLLSGHRRASFNGACGSLLNGTGFTRAELAEFTEHLIKHHSIGNVRLISDARDKNSWYFEYDFDRKTPQQTPTPAVAPTPTVAAATAPAVTAAPATAAVAASSSPSPSSAVAAAVTAALAAALGNGGGAAAAAAAAVAAATAASTAAPSSVAAPGATPTAAPGVVALSRWPVSAVVDARRLSEATAFFGERSLVALACKGTDLFTPATASVRLVALAAMEAKQSPPHDVAADDSNTVRGRVFVFDLRVADGALRQLVTLFLSDVISKPTNTLVCHDARRSLPALCAAVRLAAVPSCFDTMVAYRTLSAAHFVPPAPNTPYLTMQQAALAVTLPSPVMFDGIVESAEFWNGPLLDAQIEWAAESVRALIPLRARLLRAVPQQLVAWSDRFAASEAEVLPPVGSSATRCVVGAVYRMYDVPASEDGHTGLSLVPDTEVAERPLDAVSAGGKSNDAAQQAALDEQLTQFLAVLPADVSDALLALVDFDTDHLIANLSQVVILNNQKPTVRWQNDAAQALPNAVSLADVASRWSAAGWQLDANSLRLLPPPGVSSLHRVAVTLDERGNAVMLNAFLEMQRDNVRLVPDVVTRVAERRVSVAVVGKSRQGQWSLLRGLAEALARNRRVLAVDTSGCMQGFSAVGLMVERLSLAAVPGQREQHLARAFQNYDPQVIVIDHLDPIMFASNLSLWRGRRIPVVACIQAPSLASVLSDAMLKPMLMLFETMIDVHAPFRFSVHDNFAASMASLTQPMAPASLASQRWRDAVGNQWLTYAQVGVNQLQNRAVALDGNFDWIAGVMATI